MKKEEEGRKKEERRRKKEKDCARVSSANSNSKAVNMLWIVARCALLTSEIGSGVS